MLPFLPGEAAELDVPVPSDAHRELLLVAAATVPLLAAEAVVILATGTNATVCCEWDHTMQQHESSLHQSNIPASFVPSPQRQIRQS